MCNLSWTPHASLEKDNYLNHSCVSPTMGCLEYIYNKTNNCMYQPCVSSTLTLIRFFDLSISGRLSTCAWIMEECEEFGSMNNDDADPQITSFLMCVMYITAWR